MVILGDGLLLFYPHYFNIITTTLKVNHGVIKLHCDSWHGEDRPCEGSVVPERRTSPWSRHPGGQGGFSVLGMVYPMDIPINSVKGTLR
jgi:hypothetical protein